MLFKAAYTWGCGIRCVYWEAVVEDITVSSQIAFMGTLGFFVRELKSRAGEERGVSGEEDGMELTRLSNDEGDAIDMTNINVVMGDK